MTARGWLRLCSPFSAKRKIHKSRTDLKLTLLLESEAALEEYAQICFQIPQVITKPKSNCEKGIGAV